MTKRLLGLTLALGAIVWAMYRASAGGGAGRNNKRTEMHTRYVFFYTARAAIFQIYALLLLLLTLFFIGVTSTIDQLTVTVGTFVYIITVVSWAFYIDRKNRGKRTI